MTLKTFFEKFELFADAPDAIVKMRGLLLDLAATGRLVPREGEWETRPLQSLATKIGSGATPAGGRESYLTKGIPLIRSMNVHFRGFDKTGLVFLSDQQAKELANVTVKAGDVLLNITGASIGRVAIAPAEMAGARVNQHVTIIRATSDLHPRFLCAFLASPVVQRMIDEIQVGATRQALTKGMIEQFQIPLPAMSEQTRIVAKVDELMALCDRLEAQQQERESRHAALARAALGRFLESPTAENLQLLFHPSCSLAPADLRKTILALAVQGELLPNIAKSPATLGDVIELISGQHLMADEQNEARRGIPYLTGPSDFGEKYPTVTRWTEAPKVVAQRGDILITVKGAGVGKTNRLIEGPTAIGRQLMAVRVTGAEPDFVHLALMNAASHFQASMTGIAIPGIGRRDVLDLKVELPPADDQKRIVAQVAQLLALADQLESQLATARSAAATLLSAAVAELTGQAS